MVEGNNNYYEIMGFWEHLGLGVTFVEKTYNFVMKRVGGLPQWKKYVTYNNMKNLRRIYLSLMKKFHPAEFVEKSITDIDDGTWDTNTIALIRTMREKTKNPLPIIDNFLRALWYGAHTGKLGYADWNPYDYKAQVGAVRDLNVNDSFIDDVKDFGGKVASGLMVGLTVFGLGYFLSMKNRKRRF